MDETTGMAGGWLIVVNTSRVAKPAAITGRKIPENEDW
jgi:hypothetical protein